MAETPSKPVQLTSRQMADALFLLEDRLSQQGANVVNRGSVPMAEGRSALFLEGEKNGLKTRYLLDEKGKIEVTRSNAQGAYVTSAIHPNGSMSTSRVNANGTVLTEAEERALISGAKQETISTHSRHVLGLGPAKEGRDAAAMGQAIETRADTRLAEIMDGQKLASRTLQDIADRRIADRMAEDFERMASHPEKLTAQETQRMTAVLTEQGLDPAELRQGMTDFSQRLRGAEGEALVAGLRDSAQAKEGAELFGTLLKGEASFGREAAAAARVVEDGAGAIKTFGKVAGHIAAPIGLGLAAHEASAKGAEAERAVSEGRLSAEALPEYYAIHAAQAATVFDPSIVAGEQGVQKAYSDFAARHKLDPELKESLRPSALTDVLPTVKRMGPDDLSDAQNQFDAVYEGVSRIKPEDLAPEDRPALEALQENKRRITETESQLEGRSGQAGGFDRSLALSKLGTYQKEYKVVYDDLKSSGQIDGIARRIDEDARESKPDAPEEDRRAMMTTAQPARAAAGPSGPS